MHFEAPWDGWLIATTIASVVFAFVVFLVLGVAAARSGNTLVRVVVTLCFVPGLVGIALCYWWSPRGFTIDETSFRIERPSGPLVFPFAEITGVDELDDLVELRRVLGSGGLFGYYGQYSEPSLGTFKLYATRKTDRIVIRTKSGPIVVTPAKPRELQALLRERVKR